MAGALVEYLTTDTQMKLYRGTVLTVFKKCREELQVDNQVLLPYTCNATDLSYRTSISQHHTHFSLWLLILASIVHIFSLLLILTDMEYRSHS